MARRGVALIKFHGGRQAAGVQRLGRMATMKVWPGGRVATAVRIKPIVGITRFDAMVQVQAADSRGLRRIFQFIEDNFSHVEGFEY